MKTLIISDIHSNLEALETFVEFYDKYEGEKEIVCLGDIVGYGPSPSECLGIIISLTSKIVMGNHDSAVVDVAGEVFMNRYARHGVRFSRDCLTDNHKKTISGFQYRITDEDIIYAHSTPINPDKWRYIDDEYTAAKYLSLMEQRLAFVGHSHIPGVFSEGEVHENGGTYRISKDANTIVNVGSIGQPRDNDPRLCFFIFDKSDWTLEKVRLSYDIEKTVERIRKSGLPSFLGERLRTGF